MYTLKLSHGYVDEPETETVEILGTYESQDEAFKAAENKFCEVMEGLTKDCELRFGEVAESRYGYSVAYGYVDEYNTLINGHDHYYEVSVKEDY